MINSLNYQQVFVSYHNGSICIMYNIFIMIFGSYNVVLKGLCLIRVMSNFEFLDPGR